MNKSQFMSYGMLGLLVGLLVGLSGGDIAKALLAGIFAFSGGSAIALSTKVDDKSRQWASSATFAVSFFAIVGLLIGILANQHKLLGTHDGIRTIDELITSVIADELERRKKGGETINVAELIALLKAKQELQNDFYISDTSPVGITLENQISTTLQQHAIGLLNSDQALEEIRNFYAKTKKKE